MAPPHSPQNSQDHGERGLSFRGVAVMTEAAMTAETVKLPRLPHCAAVCRTSKRRARCSPEPPKPSWSLPPLNSTPLSVCSWSRGRFTYQPRTGLQTPSRITISCGFTNEEGKRATNVGNLGKSCQTRPWAIFYVRPPKLFVLGRLVVPKTLQILGIIPM